MSAAVMGSTYPAPAPRSQSADTTSSVYPNRPIRPLPKRRLRSRLAPDVADSILYPPAPSTTTPLFYFPYSYADPGYARVTQSSQQCIGQDGHEHRHQEDGLDSDEEEDGGLVRRHQSVHNLSTSSAPCTFSGNAQQHQLKMNISTSLPMPKPQGPNSTTSSADGYESFENTNNKKKRKIPTPGNANGHHSHLSADLANLGISSPSEVGRPSHDELDNGGGQHYGSSSTTASSASGNGMSGSGYGRGRPSRRGYGGKLIANYGGRSPLGVSTNGLNGLSSGNTAPPRERESPLRPQHRPPITNTATGKNCHLQPNLVADPFEESDSQGIISAAIARTAEKRVELPAKGQENVSLLQQHPKTQPNKTQFTFTYESPLPTTINFTAEERSRRPLPASSAEPAKPRMAIRSGHPGPGTASGPDHLSRGMATHGTQTSPDMAGAAGRPQGPESSMHNPGNQSQAQQPPGTNQPAAQQQKKPRPRRSGKEYALAAGRRRLQQEYNNYHNPPASSDDIWICEFCEYESIFGEPPEALMRQYEIKDRKERRHLAEKRRLLEKAKLKGRKGKKGNKIAAKNSGATATNQQQQQQHSADQGQTHSQSTQSEEYMADEAEDDSVMAMAPQAPAKGVYGGGVQHGKPLTRNTAGPVHSVTAVCGDGGGTTVA